MVKIIWTTRNNRKQTASHTLAMYRQSSFANSDAVSLDIFPVCSRLSWSVGETLWWPKSFNEISDALSCLVVSLPVTATRLGPLWRLAIAIKQPGTGRLPCVWYMFNMIICTTRDNTLIPTSMVMYEPVIWGPIYFIRLLCIIQHGNNSQCNVFYANNLWL